MTRQFEQEPQSRPRTHRFAIPLLTIALFISESLCLVGANSSNSNNQQQIQNTYLQRPDPNGRPQLMVAIYCGAESSSALYHNQYIDLESRKWRTDRDVTAFCTQDKQAVLNYCKKVYPQHDIRNIVESSRPYKIENWCKLGSSKRRCHARLTVRPYRCLEGTFQSDALLVPERCVFDHVHNKSVCENSDTWNKTASESCRSKDMKLQSFGMLQPCGLDVFSGVEFVCCPNLNAPESTSSKPPQQSSNNSQQEGNSFAQASNGMVNWPHASANNEDSNSIKIDDDSQSGNKKQHRREQATGEQNNDDSNDDGDEDEEDEDEDEDEYDDDSTSWNNNNDKSSSTTSTTTTSTTTTTTERPIDHYLSHFDVAHEHDEFKKAELAVESSYRDKITNVMREWSQLDGRYEEMKKKDSQAAEEFKRKITYQFKKTIEALEEEGSAQRHQLASMHAERAMALINRRKKSAMECLTLALDRMPIRVRRVEKCIAKLLRALEKDRAHTLRQYKNLLNLNTREALHEKKIILDHLITLNRAANQSIAMLDRSPALVEKLKKEIITLWHNLRNIPLNEPITRESEIKILEKYEEEVAQHKIERERKRLAQQEANENNIDNRNHDSTPSATISEQEETKEAPEVVTETNAVVTESLPQVSHAKRNNDDKLENIEKSSQTKDLVNSQTMMDSQTNPSLTSVPTPKVDHEMSSTNEQTHYQIESAKFSHLKADSPYHELSYSVKHEPMNAHFRFGYASLLASSCAAMILLAFIGVKYYSRNSNRAYRRQGFAEVGRSCPEERSVTSMQFNGYENPAYKFFEATEA